LAKCVLLFTVTLFFLAQVAVCNLASIALNQYVKPDKTYDFEKLKYVAKVATKNLNKVNV
jgi:ribonucleoside-diphosphate reductase subunit M1